MARSYVARSGYGAKRPGGMLTPPRTPKRSIASMAGKYVQRQLFNTVASAIPYGRTALGAYRLGRRLFSSKKTQTVAAPRRGLKTMGKYAGKVKRASKRKVNRDLVYQRNGFVETYETNGTVNDPDCVWLGHCSQSQERTIWMIAAALVRKLLQESINYNAVDISEKAPGLSFDNPSNVYKFLFLNKDMSDNAVTIDTTYVSTAADTLITWVGLVYDWLYKFAANLSPFINLTAGGDIFPHKIQIYIQDGNVAQFWDYQGELALEECTAHVKSISSFKMQNRTLGFDGGNTADDVTNNPLVGRQYVTNGNPKTRDNKFSSTTDNLGVLLKRTDNNPKEPALPAYFINIVASSSCQLQPGEIKKSVLVFQKSMTVLKFLKWLRLTVNNVSGFPTNPGQCAFFALEDMINVNAAQKITVSYERNLQSMCYISLHKGKVCTQAQYASTYNNTT